MDLDQIVNQIFPFKVVLKDFMQKIKVSADAQVHDWRQESLGKTERPKYRN